MKAEWRELNSGSSGLFIEDRLIIVLYDDFRGRFVRAGTMQPAYPSLLEAQNAVEHDIHNALTALREQRI